MPLLRAINSIPSIYVCICGSNSKGSCYISGVYYYFFLRICKQQLTGETTITIKKTTY